MSNESNGVTLETAVYHALQDIAAEVHQARERALWEPVEVREEKDAKFYLAVAEAKEREGLPVTALLFRNAALGRGI